MVFKKFINKFMQFFSICNSVSYNSYFQEIVDYIEKFGLHKFLSILTLTDVDKIILKHNNNLEFFDFSKKIELSNLLTKIICEIYSERFKIDEYSSIMSQLLYPIILTHLIDDYESKYNDFIEKIKNIDENFEIKEFQDKETENIVEEEKILCRNKIIHNFLICFILNLLEKYNKIVLDQWFNEQSLNSMDTNILEVSTKLSLLYANFKNNKIKYDSLNS